MKKLFSAFLKVFVLMLSFSAIAIAVLMRNSIDIKLLIAIVVLAIALISIVIVLLVNDNPTPVAPPVSTYQAPKAQEAPKAQDAPKATLMSSMMIDEEENEEVDEIIKPLPDKNITVKKSKLKVRKLPNGDITFSKFVETYAKPTVNSVNRPTSSHPANEEVVFTAPVSENTRPTSKETETNQSEIPSPFILDLKLTHQHHENLISVMEGMEEMNLILDNPDYDNYDLLPQDTKYFQYNFKDLPVVTLIKQRNQTYKVMAGVNTTDLHEISLLDSNEVDIIDNLYRNSQHMQGIISGGRYRMINSDTKEVTEKNQAQSVQLRIYHNL